MEEPRTKADELTPADLAAYGILPKPPEGLAVVKDTASKIPEMVASIQERVPLFSDSEADDFRSQWSSIQTGFVDGPRRTVGDADKLVAAVMQRLQEGFTLERSGLEKQWDSGNNVSTENLRVALQRYRSFFDRLLQL